MSGSTKHAVRAFALSPLVGPLVWFLAFDDLDGSAGSLLLTLLYGGIVAYAIALFMRVPAYLIINLRWGMRPWHIIAIAGGLGAVVPLNMAHSTSPVTLLQGRTLGAAAGIVFWLLWR